MSGHPECTCNVWGQRQQQSSESLYQANFSTMGHAYKTLHIRGMR